MFPLEGFVNVGLVNTGTETKTRHRTGQTPSAFGTEGVRRDYLSRADFLDDCYDVDFFLED